MKVWELIEELKKYDPELRVVKQKDDEGNGYHFMYAVDDDCYIPKSDLESYYLEVYPEEYLEEMELTKETCEQVLVIV